MNDIDTIPEDFDPETYLRLNPDVAAKGIDAGAHYLTAGRSEGRTYKLDKVNAGSLPAEFDADTYLRLNPDVAAKGVDPHAHYLTSGRSEGRAYKLEQIDPASLPDDFDPDTYLRLNPDVAAKGADAQAHYLTYGRFENRAYKLDKDGSIPVSKNNNMSYIARIRSASAATSFSVPKVVAFYLPQYHRVKENDDWWGEGFTEWTNVKKAKPNYKGHAQPHIPLNRNYYDLSQPSVQRDQAELAKKYGISAFCYYMYWFNGRRVLETPLDARLNDSSIAMDFCVCWANENWTRTWDGKEKDILLEQNHSSETDRSFIKDAMKYLAHPRYLRHDDKLVLLVYRVDLMEDSKATAEIWRNEVRLAGLGDLHLCAVQFYGIGDPRDWGFDAAVEFPPHGWLVPNNVPEYPIEYVNQEFAGTVLDYKKSVDFALRKPVPDYCWHRCAFPGWDNTARRQNNPHIFANPSPEDFNRWLLNLMRQSMLMASGRQPMVFINAWNEWGEGAHLEPDEENKFAYLEAVQSALNSLNIEFEVISILTRLRNGGSYSERDSDEIKLLNIIRGYEQAISKLLVGPL
ncbi:putative glycosyltransferase [Methylobacterium sp. GXF4]|uniref:glycosyltransferase WbsX family protein n=1 Tax=Methylobacterium sp. GXF4 TaxID=1096546 RepID=UPI00026996E0|nr:glycoside hydrolase family 99-like domain-containing protein [Methylobacterium sp. GXF4]EIZ82170.1 putative glycosyltransferase [Methylobacterium sp. GXF4]